MSPKEVHKMMSFGHCDKVKVGNDVPIGHYGNGFKSGSMRLGKDALVFTKNGTYNTVGFLSQVFSAFIPFTNPQTDSQIQNYFTT
jgi:hypothetical protein